MAHRPSEHRLRGMQAPARAWWAVMTAAALAGCAGPQARGPEAVCRDAALQWAVGQQANEANARRLHAESGAGLVNVVGPHSRVHPDVRTDRLRIYVDKDNAISRVACE